MPEGLVLQASLSCPLVQLEGFSTRWLPFSMAFIRLILLEEFRSKVEVDGIEMACS